MSNLDFRNKKTWLGIFIGVILGGIICAGIIISAEKLADLLIPDDEIVELSYIFNGVESVTYSITDEQTIDALYKAVTNIETLDETDLIYDDWDEIFVFKTHGGDEYVYSFNGHHLYEEDKYYLIKNDAKLWELAHQIQEENR